MLGKETGCEPDAKSSVKVSRCMIPTSSGASRLQGSFTKLKKKKIRKKAGRCHFRIPNELLICLFIHPSIHPFVPILQQPQYLRNIITGGRQGLFQFISAETHMPHPRHTPPIFKISLKSFGTLLTLMSARPES